MQQSLQLKLRGAAITIIIIVIMHKNH